MKRFGMVTLMLVFVPLLWADDQDSEESKDVGVRTQTVVTQETAQQQTVPPPTPNYSGDLMNRSTLTGDWGGLRNDLACQGITLDVGIHNILQGNAHGGADTKNGLRYSGSSHYTLTLDTERMGLWKGGTILLHGETKWGRGIQGKVGSLVPVNLDAFKPSFTDECQTALSEWILFQALFDGKLILIGGKLDGARAFDRNVFANDERTQFLNVGLRNNPIIPAFLPYTNLGAGFVLNLTDWMSITTAVADSEGRAKTTGFETTFHGPTHTTLINELGFKVKPFGLDGNQRIGWIWSSKEFPHLQPISPFKETGPMLMKVLGPKLFNKVGKLLPFKHSPDNVAMYYNFDQYLHQEECDRTQGFGLFGRFGWARQDVNPISHFYSIGMGGRGVLPERDRDTMGIGYFYSDLSNKLPDSMFAEQGIECFYNIEVTPWCHVSPDLQVIVNPGGTKARDVSLVYGLRVAIDL